MVPVIIIPVSPVVSVAAVLVIGPLSGQVVGSVTPRTVTVHVSPVSIMVVLVPVLFILMVPITAPRRIVVATTVVEFPLPLPVSSVCITEVSLVGVTVVITWVSVHLWAMGGRQMRLLRMKAVRGVGLREQGVPARARGLWSEWLLPTKRIILLLLFLLFLRSFLMSHFI